MVSIEDAVTSVREMLGLVEKGLLVRNTSRDGDRSAFVIDGLRLVSTLQKAKQVVDGFDQEGGRERCR